MGAPRHYDKPRNLPGIFIPSPSHPNYKLWIIYEFSTAKGIGRLLIQSLCYTGYIDYIFKINICCPVGT